MGKLDSISHSLEPLVVIRKDPSKGLIWNRGQSHMRVIKWATKHSTFQAEDVQPVVFAKRQKIISLERMCLDVHR